MLCGGALDVALQQQTHHVLDLVTNQVGHHANYAIAAHGHDQECLVVVAAPDFEVGRGLNDAGDLVHVAAGFFRAYDVIDLAQPQRRLVSHVYAGTAHDVVDDAGKISLACDRLKVLVDPLLRGFVVVGHHEQQAVDALLLSFLAELDALGGVVGAGAGYDHALVTDRLFDLAEKAHLLVGGERGRFAGGAGQDDAVAARVEKGMGELLSLLKVDRALVVEGSNHRCEKSTYLCHVRLLYSVA